MTEENNVNTANETQASAATESAPVVPKKIERNRPRRKGRRNDRRKEPKEFEESILRIARVTRVVKGGRRMRFQVTVVIGDKKGRVGMGVGKSGEVLGGIQKAIAAAKKNLVKVAVGSGTVAHPVSAKFKASKVFLLPAQEGKGLIAGGAVRKILELAGIRDVLSKAHGSRNSLNLARATFAALADLPTKEVAAKKSTKKEADATEKKVEKKKAPAKKAVAKKKPVAKKAVAKDSAEKVEKKAPAKKKTTKKEDK
ncbi:30S ribosomal protein S5 [bacterium DOLZORAL124_38_8]|nr:MAG: 30S ribosomal protein S5 [bacterium DOLZORAL124_38_8]